MQDKDLPILKVNIIAADDRAMEGARALATMIFIILNRINLVPTGQGSIQNRINVHTPRNRPK